MIASVWLAHFKLFSRQSTTIDSLSSAENTLKEIDTTIKESSGASTDCTRILCIPDCLNGPNPAVDGGPNWFGCTWPPTNLASTYAPPGGYLILSYWPLDANGNPIEPNESSGPFTNYILYSKRNDNKGNTPTTHNLVQWTSSFTQSAGARKNQVRTIATNVTDFTYAYFDNGTPSTAENATEIKITIKFLPQDNLNATEEYERTITSRMINKID